MSLNLRLYDLQSFLFLCLMYVGLRICVFVDAFKSWWCNSYIYLVILKSPVKQNVCMGRIGAPSLPRCIQTMIVSQATDISLRPRVGAYDSRMAIGDAYDKHMTIGWGVRSNALYICISYTFK